MEKNPFEAFLKKDENEVHEINMERMQAVAQEFITLYNEKVLPEVITPGGKYYHMTIAEFSYAFVIMLSSIFRAQGEQCINMVGWFMKLFTMHLMAQQNSEE